MYAKTNNYHSSALEKLLFKGIAPWVYNRNGVCFKLGYFIIFSNRITNTTSV